MSQHRKMASAVIVVPMDVDEHDACAVTQPAPPYFDAGAPEDSLDVLAHDGARNASSSSERP